MKQIAEDNSVCVLLSCMNQNDCRSLLQDTNVQTSAVVVNQTDNDSVEQFTFVNKKGEECNVRIINTTERGLSRSRNMAIKNATGDICLLCDDDERLEDDYCEKIQRAYQIHPKESVVVFTIERRDMDSPKIYPPNEQYVNFKQLLQTSSVQITFKKDFIVDANILFDIMLGSGTGNGAGEEIKFLMDCKKAGVKIYYVPVSIGAVLSGNSTWFKGFTPEYMKNLGWSSRRSLGNVLGFAYILIFGLRHKKQYSENMNAFKAYIYLLKGFFENR